MAVSKKHLPTLVLFIVTSVSLPISQAAKIKEKIVNFCLATGNPVRTGSLRSHFTSKYDSDLYLNCNSWDCNYAILNSKCRMEGYMSPSTIGYHHFKISSNFIKNIKAWLSEICWIGGKISQICHSASKCSQERKCSSGLWPELKLSLVELKPGSIDIYISIVI